MAHDPVLADRVREAVELELGPGAAPAAEMRMFGGLAFLVGGHMAVVVSGQGGLMVRCAPERTDELGVRDGAGPMVMRGREMTGWLRVTADAVGADDTLRDWVAIGVDHAASLPPKP